MTEIIGNRSIQKCGSGAQAILNGWSRIQKL